MRYQAALRADLRDPAKVVAFWAGLKPNANNCLDKSDQKATPGLGPSRFTPETCLYYVRVVMLSS